jgi:MFS family permease
MPPPKQILPVIVFSQFCCTSLWFAGNGVMTELVSNFGLKPNALGHMTSAVQFGFIIGTLSFAILTIADRFSPSKVFLVSALLGAILNLGITWEGNVLASLLGFRFATGFFLAGIYPVGMKIAADYFQKGLGKSLGYLVGALVLGTALPHLLKGFSVAFPWKYVLMTTSSLAILGGGLIFLLVPDGPHRKASQSVDLSSFFKVFRYKEFRAAAFGYFGHMWELYAFWAFVPVMLSTYIARHPDITLDVSLWSFAIIGIGGLSCVLGGYLSMSLGAKRTAFIALLSSGICCLISPFVFGLSSPLLFIVFLLFWGMVVIADSPLFSTLVAQNAEAKIKGTALTIVNCIGFAITIFSIQLLSYMTMQLSATNSYLVLAIGPALGLWALLRT